MPLRLNARYQYAGVYMIKNKKNGKVYIGSSINIEKRLSDHRRLLKLGKHECKEMQRDYDKHNPMTTHVLYVEIVSNFYALPPETRKRLYALEHKYIQEYDAINTGYNRAP